MWHFVESSEGVEVVGGLVAAEALRVLGALDASGHQTWVAGGWGVDAVLGRQTRLHRDLDLAVDVTDGPIDQVLVILMGMDYEIETDWRPVRVELAAQGERWVDLHPVAFDEQGTGWQANVDDLPPFRYPPDAFTRGFIEGVEVGCLSVSQQLLFHTGYQPRPQDLADIDWLRHIRDQPDELAHLQGLVLGTLSADHQAVAATTSLPASGFAIVAPDQDRSAGWCHRLVPGFQVRETHIVPEPAIRDPRSVPSSKAS